ncbi:SAM-dependent methyltransferase [Entomospira culicis]|uniref:SAM-dependent methyltransferase n=1 Tax=Entomospira culicis TaxID=2719989 RepID=A0A968KTZ3_9SPIO|nr:SAM-dependent methyltransferase [Entomospira culicis]NIZ18744.1 SAM-dependent methyltransferase [Entomospira culicis]NIZ68959.1 SAM-dependent methyltransferase [Entomospira culicis]WDI37551.1 hypothetical protein PVA46_01825 [Entomospira culicis]WDI39179.1 hypothetical protein PVA47_01830 [Entomospira culicis]
MYRVDRNNFYKEQKNATIYTPKATSAFLFALLSPHIKKDGLIFDPCVGAGSLLEPFHSAGYRVLGIDIEDQGFIDTQVVNYLSLTPDFFSEKPALILMNPPFNVDAKTKAYIKEHYSGRPLLPEIWLLKVIELFGKDIPIVMFTPYGFRLNQTQTSKRWQRFSSGHFPEITSIISLPKDLFEGILFHSEILIFNLPNLKGHYFYQL